MDIISKKIKCFDLFVFSILLIPIWWIIGGKFFIFHLISFILFLNVIIYKRRNNIKISFHKIHIIMGVFILIYGISIVINFNIEDFQRIVASIYNLSYWCMGLFIMISFYNIDISVKDIKFLCNAISINMMFQIILLILAFGLWIFSVKDIQLKSLIGTLFNSNIELLQDSTSMQFYIPQWSNGKEVLRFVGLAIYPTECAVITSIMIIYSGIISKNKKIKILVIFLGGLMVLATRSRTVILALPFSVGLIYLIAYKNKVKNNLIQNKKIFMLLMVGVLIILTFICFKYNFIEMFFLSRSGSNVTRLKVYKETINIFIQNPLLGSSYKIYIPGLEVPVGSHSTYLGILMRTGLFGFLMFISSLIIQIATWWSNRRLFENSNDTFRKIWIITGASMLLFIIWFITEDIDAPQIAAILYFINAALITSSSKFSNNKNNASKKNINIALVGSSGGHLMHLIQLKDWYRNNDRFWVTFKKADATSQLKNERAYWCYYPTNRNIKNLIKNTFLAVKILFLEKPDLIISSGAAPAIPFFYLGKIMGSKLIYIEVYDRIDLPTLTGKIVYPICDKFVVQWEEQLKYYPKGSLLGGLF